MSQDESGVAPQTMTSEEEDLEAQVAYQTIKRRREARKRKRVIIIAALSALALIGIIVFISARASQLSESKQVDPFSITGNVRIDDFKNTVKVNGATEPSKSTMVTPEVDGFIESVMVSEGDQVNEGDVLFTIKNTEIDKSVRDAETAVQSAQETADKANRAVDEAYDAYNKAVNTYNDAINAYNNAVNLSGVSGDASDTSNSLDMPEFDEATLRSAITSSEEAYNQALKDLESAKNSRDETVEKANKRTVRAPASGTLVSMTAVVGASVGAGSTSGTSSSSGHGPLAQISDLSQMKVIVQVNEADISSIKLGQEGTATFSAIPGLSLGATVQHISTVATGSSDSGGSTGGASGSGGVVTYAVDLVIPNPDPRLKPGMTASVNIVTLSIPNATIVPVAAISEDENGGSQVIVVDSAAKKETHTVSVEVQAKNSSDAAVTGDLKEDDKVMLISAEALTAGMGTDSAAV